MSDQPNFLFIITDQHRADHTGFGGNPLVRTPCLDALAKRSMQFDRAFVANPICMPNRSSILTGRMPSVHGTRFNGVPLDWASETFVRVLREAGWDTALIGKAHFQNFGLGAGLIARFFPSSRDAVRARYAKGWDEYENRARHAEGRVAVADDFYGFAHTDLVLGHGDQCGGHYYQWLVEQGIDPAAQGAAFAVDRYEGWQQVYKPAVSQEHYPTSYVEKQSVQYIEDAALRDNPFFLWCSFPDPHHPFTPPGEYWEMYDPADVELPRTFEDAHGDSLPIYRQRLKHKGSQRGPVQPFAVSADQLRHAAAAEYGMISMLDSAIGRILESLERTGQANNTIVVFTSDHGDMFGDHGMMLKGGMHYEGCLRIPLLISAPGRKAGASSALVSSIDLAQTLLEAAGLPPYHGMQGKSLMPLLEDPTQELRESLLIEEDEILDMAGLGVPLRMRTLLTQTARLTLYDGADAGELFDLEKDPDELRNLFADRSAQAQRAALTERLSRLLMATADTAPIPTHFA